jgi:hypothetical protein
LVQHSRSLLRGWRANCDIKLLLYYSNPNCPDICELEDVCRYVVLIWVRDTALVKKKKKQFKIS